MEFAINVYTTERVFFATTGVQEKLLGISTFKTQKRRLYSPIHPKHAQQW